MNTKLHQSCRACCKNDSECVVSTSKEYSLKKINISLFFSILKPIIQFTGYTNAWQWNPERIKIRFCTYMLYHTEIRNIFSRTSNFSSPLRQLLKSSNEFCYNYRFNYLTIFQYKQINQHTYAPSPKKEEGYFLMAAKS